MMRAFGESDITDLSFFGFFTCARCALCGRPVSLTRLGCRPPPRRRVPRAGGWKVDLWGSRVQERRSWARSCLSRRESCARGSEASLDSRGPEPPRGPGARGRVPSTEPGPLRTRSGKVRSLARPAGPRSLGGRVSAESLQSESTHVTQFIFNVTTLPTAILIQDFSRITLFR